MQISDNESLSGLPSGMPFMGTQNNSGNMVFMTDPEIEIQKLEANFRGQVENEQGKLVKKFPARMNDKGINQVIGVLRSVVSRTTFMSNVDDKLLYAIMEDLANTLAKMLMMFRVDFEIENDAERSSIFFQCTTTAHIAIQRALQEGDKRFWKGNVQEITYGISGDKNKGNLLNKLAPRSW